MAAPLPAPFKKADIARFATKAKELEKVKPVVAYWCNYFVVNQILNKGLHTESNECMAYTTTLMDKLETFKNENADNDAVHDDVAAQAYIEQFAQDVFNRADTAMMSNKATAQTAQTFQAASTLLDLLAIWQTPLSQEIAVKSKYAKFHALRIAKALRSGEDPNLSNPTREPHTEPPALSPDDPEVRRINGLQPTVEDVPDSSLLPSASDNPPADALSPTTHVQTAPTAAPRPEVPSVGASASDGYFPIIPTFTSEQAAPSLPTAPEDSAPNVTMVSPGSTSAPMSSPAANFYIAQGRPIEPSVPAESPGQPQVQPVAPSQYHMPTPTAPHQFISPPQQTTLSAPSLAPQPSIQAQQPALTQLPQTMPGQYNRDDESIMQAQKHAKWAISALNFEDVDTAVKELRIALRALGA
ncbi:uncharacterized protein PV09_01766 [Verruconis gallopava]|uniref:DUF605-domain-containing protein n=1 Tax=Verruconis gallopava TaxID=253628 RepID=A0A0D1XYG7_9PEZI|nr:uncharacterized protein PV09_01766 [Verruconis gallopava]KIW07851.1 hypothetical protein PV09_01766 [Verruconis gallopava]